MVKRETLQEPPEGGTERAGETREVGFSKDPRHGNAVEDSVSRKTKHHPGRRTLLVGLLGKWYFLRAKIRWVHRGRVGLSGRAVSVEG